MTNTLEIKRPAGKPVTTYHEKVNSGCSLYGNYENLVDIRTVKLFDGASRLDNALYFLEQIKNPHLFKVGEDVVELCFTGEESLADVLAKHFNRKRSLFSLKG